MSDVYFGEALHTMGHSSQSAAAGHRLKLVKSGLGNSNLYDNNDSHKYNLLHSRVICGWLELLCDWLMIMAFVSRQDMGPAFCSGHPFMAANSDCINCLWDMRFPWQSLGWQMCLIESEL